MLPPSVAIMNRVSPISVSSASSNTNSSFNCCNDSDCKRPCTSPLHLSGGDEVSVLTNESVANAVERIESFCHKILVEETSMDMLSDYLQQLEHQLSLLNDTDEYIKSLHSRLNLVSLISTLLSIHRSSQDKEERDNSPVSNFFSVGWRKEDFERVEEQLVLAKSKLLCNDPHERDYEAVLRALQVQAVISTFYHRLKDLQQQNAKRPSSSLEQVKNVVDSYVAGLKSIFDASDNGIPDGLVGFLLPQLYRKDMDSLAGRLLTYLERNLLLNAENEFSCEQLQQSMRSLIIQWNNLLLEHPVTPGHLEFPSCVSINCFDKDDVSSWGEDNGELLRFFEQEHEQNQQVPDTLIGMVIAIPSITPVARSETVTSDDVFDSFEHTAIADAFSYCHAVTPSTSDLYSIDQSHSSLCSSSFPGSLSGTKRKGHDGSSCMDSFSDNLSHKVRETSNSGPISTAKRARITALS